MVVLLISVGILIMEDDSGLRRIYSKALQRSDYQVDEAPTITAARELLKAKEYDIFVCDIHMGRELGTELVAEFGETLKESDTQVVMCSAHGEYRSQTKEMGVEYFLEKPVSLNKLLSLIHSLTMQRHVSI